MKLTQSEEQTLRRAARILEKQASYSSKVFSSTSEAMQYFQFRLSGKEREQFDVAYLDNQYRLIKCETLFYGTINGASVYPREVVKAALQHNAAAVILAHNHPSGISDPSRADEAITTRIVDALGLVDIKVLDHIIVGAQPFSFSDKGLL